MVQDTMEAMDDDELEEEAEEEVNKVLFQITDGKKVQRSGRMWTSLFC
jgi:charged multivesicular body protein 3